MTAQTEHPLTSILRQAIQAEEDSYNLYSTVAQAVRLPHTRDLLQELAQDEVGHKQHLEALLAGDPAQIVAAGHEAQIIDLKIGDFLVAQPLSPDADFQDVLIVASKREAASHDLYADLAALACRVEERKLFEYLAEEELGHKNRVEAIYEQTVYKDF